MITINFKSYGNYVTDSVYQWDINQICKITGLGLSVIPEVHFANCAMDAAIVRHASGSGNDFSVKIPNSLLQKPYPIDAHIGIYSGSTFKVIETVRIPVIPRKRPEDYYIEDTDEEIYSFKALENAIANMPTYSQLAGMESELKTADAATNARIDNMIVGGSTLPGSVINVGVKWDHDTEPPKVRIATYGAFAVLTVERLYGLGVSDPVKICDILDELLPTGDVYSDTLPYGMSVYIDKDDKALYAYLPTADTYNEYVTVHYHLANYEINNTELTDIRVGADGVTYDTAGTAVREQISFLRDESSALKTVTPITYEVGTITNGVYENHANRARFTDKIPAIRAVVTLGANSDYLYGYVCYDENGVYDGVDHGWNSFTGESLLIDGCNFAMNFRRVDDTAITEADLNALASLVTVTQFNIFTDFNELKNTVTRVLSDNIRADALNSINIEYGRKNGASYVFARIPKVTNDGNVLKPKLRLTSVNGGISGNKTSALTFARENNSIFTLNAGLFNTTTLTPVGQTIIDGVSVVNTPMVDDMGTAISAYECYPLCIDANGDLTAPYKRNADTADMIADGVIYAVTGWGKLVDNFVACSDVVDNEIVHPGAYIRQGIGQFQNGDYFVCTVDQSRNGVENEAGLTNADWAELLISKGVKFAYSLDGGGSAETVIGNRQINPIYEGSAGRSVPTVITFEVE